MADNLSKQEKQERKDNLVNKILWIPIFILLAIIPLIIHAAVVYPTSEVVDVLNKTYVVEMYANYKATLITILCVLMAILLFLSFDKTKVKWDKMIKVYIIGGGLYLVVSLIATLMSKYKQVAWWGMPNRAEGMVIVACYVFMMAYTAYSLMKMENYKYLVAGLSVLVVLMTIFGIFEFTGHNLYTNTKFFKNLMISSEVKALGDIGEITNDYESGKVMVGMGNYNYVGSFGAMVVPLFVTLTIFLKGRKKKVFCGVIALCSMFILFASTSRAGLIGLASAILVGIIVFGKKIIKGWKFTVPIVAAFVVILIGFNVVTGGKIFSRIPTIFDDATQLFASSEEGFDYRDYIPIREITHEDNKEKIVFQTGTLYIGNNENTPVFTDETGNVVDYQMDVSGTFTTVDERFASAVFTYGEVSGATEGETAPKILKLTVNNVPTFYFLFDDTKGVVLADPCPLEEMEIVDPPTFGFEGKEKVGSARGYIWSRSIPLMKSTILVGNGPDTFAIEFPQDDYLGKWWAYDTPNMIIDKVHNMYLQIFIDNGGLALVGFLILVIGYIVQSFKLYAFKGFYEDREVIGIATMLAIVGYLGAALFNDSMVSVAPIFWILLGAGIAVNFMVNKDKEELQKRLRKVVPMNK